MKSQIMIEIFSEVMTAAQKHVTADVEVKNHKFHFRYIYERSLLER